MTHPNRLFHRGDDEAALALVERVGFATVFVAAPGEAMVAHVPVVRHGARELRFHVARGNRVHPHLAGARVLVSVVAGDGYVTPSWYVDTTDQVPTWNYVAVELEGVLTPLDEAQLLAQVDRLAALREPLASDRPWDRGKLGADAQRRMLRSIEGFSLAVETIRTTAKLSQNKRAEDRVRVREGFARAGQPGIAALMEAA